MFPKGVIAISGGVLTSRGVVLEYSCGFTASYTRKQSETSGEFFEKVEERCERRYGESSDAGDKKPHPPGCLWNLT